MTTATDKKIKYSHEGQKVFREKDGEVTQIAKYDEQSGLVEMLPEYVTFKSKVAQYLGESRLKFKEFAKLGTDFEVRGNPEKRIPPRPKKNPRLGTKTPNVVEWYYTYYPDVFVHKYGVMAFERLVRIQGGQDAGCATRTATGRRRSSGPRSTSRSTSTCIY